MEYIFGNNGHTETLLTKGSEHTHFTGFRETERRYDDCTIIDSFHITGKVKSDEDSEGNCYDWYEIDGHHRVVDRTRPIRELADALAAAALEQEARIILLEMGVSV